MLTFETWCQMIRGRNDTVSFKQNANWQIRRGLMACHKHCEDTKIMWQSHYGGTWWRKEQAGRRPDSWVAHRCLEQAGIWCLGRRVLLFGPRTAMLRRCERGLWNDEFHEPVEDAGSSSQGRSKLPRTPVPARWPQALLFPSCILCSRRYKRARTSTHQRPYVTTMGTNNASVECACTPSQTPSCPEKPH